MDEGTEAKALTQKNMKHSACLDHRIPAPRDAVERNIRLDMPLFSFQAKSRLCSVDNEGTSGLFKNFICLFLFCGCVPACMCEFVCVCLCVHAHVCVCFSSCTCRDQKINCRKWFSTFTWLPGIELRSSSDLALGTNCLTL